MASLSKRINQFELAVLLQKASSDVDELAKILDLAKLTSSINKFFATEATNAGDTSTNVTGSGTNSISTK